MPDFLLPTVIYILGSSLCFIPLFTGGLVSYGSSSINDAVFSQKGRDLSIASVTLSVPIFLGVLTDFATSITIRDKSEKIRPHVGRELLMSFERLVMTVAILIVAVPAFLEAETPNFENLWLCMRRCRLLLVAGSVQVSLCRYDKSFFSIKTTSISLTLMSMGSVIGACSTNILSVSKLLALSYVSGATILIGIIFFLRNCWKWLFYVTPQIYRWGFQRSTNCPSKGNVVVLQCCKHYLFPSMLVMSSGAASIIMIIISSIYPTINYDSDSVFYDNLGNIFFNVFTMFISDRMMKFEVIEGLYTLIESKKTYVRYISHELRTPLNSACLGLQLVCDELDKGSGKGRWRERDGSQHRETLLDVQTACRIAVEILNDLLCFDKLESGILELHKHEVPVNSFIADCVNMFGSQAREAGVTITTTSPIESDQSTPRSGASSGWLDSDTVLMDKFKMDQVLRNLISNALKFTPRGGSVSVRASFVPDRSPTATSFSSSVASSQRPHSVSNILHKLLNGFKIADSASYDTHSVHPRRGLSRDPMLDLQPEPLVRPGSTAAVAAAAVEEISREVDILDINGDHTSIDIVLLSRTLHHSTHKVSSGRLRIVVTDTGAGMSQENQARLFKEIVQFHPEVLQAGGGSGLGLYITSSIVLMHGGTIHAYSAGAGSGSTFTVEIDMQLRRPRTTLPLPLSLPLPPITKDRGGGIGCDVLNSSARTKDRDSNREIKSDRYRGSNRERERDGDDNREIKRDRGRDSLGRHRVSEMMIADMSERLSLNLRPSCSGKACVCSSTAPLIHTHTRLSPAMTLLGCMSECQSVCAAVPEELNMNQNTDVTRTSIRAPSSLTDRSCCASTSKSGSDRARDACSEGGVAYDVLVVDDSSLNRKMLCRVLRTAGCTCEEANDGQGAVNKVMAKIARATAGGGEGEGGGSKGYYDAVLMDFVMPVMDGPTATKAIRAVGYFAPIFGVTGNALDSDVDYFVRCGANAVLAKPFDFSLFKRLMKEREKAKEKEQNVLS